MMDVTQRCHTHDTHTRSLCHTHMRYRNFMITRKHADFYYNDDIVQSYIDNALVPMVKALGPETALAA